MSHNDGILQDKITCSVNFAFKRSSRTIHTGATHTLNWAPVIFTSKIERKDPTDRIII